MEAKLGMQETIKNYVIFSIEKSPIIFQITWNPTMKQLQGLACLPFKLKSPK